MGLRVTVFVYDGHTVAADRMGTTDAGFASRITKLEPWQGKVLTTCGPSDTGAAMRAWFKGGCAPQDFPNRGLPSDQCAWLIVFSASKIVEFQRFPIPIEHPLGVPYATGSGREAAMGALLMGADAAKAVQVASKVMAGCCGLGWDSIHVVTGERGGGEV